MRSILVVFVLLIVLSTPATAEDCENRIGVFRDTDMSPGQGWWDALFGQTMGFVFETLYIVLFTPFNEHTDTPITTLGGFEFRLLAPPGHTYIGAVLPDGSTNSATGPEFSVTTSHPITGDYCTLVELTVFVATTRQAEYFLAPLDNGIMFPGGICVVDAGDNMSVSTARPVLDAFDAPVFIFNADHFPHQPPNEYWPFCEPLPVVAVSLGAVKAMYR